MDPAGTGEAGLNLLLGAPVLVVGFLILVVGARGPVKHLRAGTGPWWTRLPRGAVALLAIGVVTVAGGLLLTLGLTEAAFALVYLAFVVAAVAAAVRAVRDYRARHAVVSAALAVFLLAAVGFIALGWDTASQLLLLAGAAGLLIVGLATLARRWRTDDPDARRTQAQQVTLGLGLTCQAVAQLLPPQLRSTSMVLQIVGMIVLLVGLGLLLGSRRLRRDTRD